MSTLIDRKGLIDDQWVRVDDEVDGGTLGGIEAIDGGQASLLVTLKQWQAQRDRWLAHQGPLGILLEPADEPDAIAADLAHFSLVAVDFPSFADGRGYSTGRLLRQRFHYTGPLRAVGDVLRDQLFFYARCGFDQFALRDDQDVDEALKGFADFTEVYQTAVDRRALFERRAAEPGKR